MFIRLDAKNGITDLPCSNTDLEFHGNSSQILLIVLIFNDEHFYLLFVTGGLTVFSMFSGRLEQWATQHSVQPGPIFD